MQVAIRIQNFQSLRDVSLEVVGLTALVGPSDRGKSAVVRAVSAALYNAAGAYFVRTGAKDAQVDLQWGDAPAGHQLRWRKGATVAATFDVDGVTYSKVGQKAPDAVQKLGFADVLIGARLVETETGLKPEGGEWIRPQVAMQFDPLFLLTESGTTLAEVVTRLSRLEVLQRAERSCALDLGSVKRTLKLRQGDLSAATASAEALAEAPRLRERLTHLVALDEEIEELQARRIRLRDLIARRQAAQQRCQLALPALANRNEIDQIGRDVQQAIAARAELSRRAQLAKLPKKLPKSKVALDGPELQALQTTINRWQALQRLVGGRTMRETVLQRAQHVARQAQAAVDAADAALTAFKASAPVCPVCTRPWAAA